MAIVRTKTQYDTAYPYIQNRIGDTSWADELDAIRLASYDFYDTLYDNSLEGEELPSRGTNDSPLFVPSAKRLVKTLSRYIGVNWGFVVDPDVGSSEDQEKLKEHMSNLFRRERIESIFASGKVQWLSRGDWIWQITADPDKPEGRRISVKNIDPRIYFPISDKNDPDRILGAQLIEEIVREDGIVLKVQSYYKVSHPEHPDHDPEDANSSGDIYYRSEIYSLEDYADPNKRKLIEVLEDHIVEGVGVIPLYHIKNIERSGYPFGTSELSGVENLLFSINQNASDEDLAIALTGLGMFVTDAGSPKDEAGNVVPWRVGPNSVLEIGHGKKFEKIPGITTIQPNQDHLKYLEDSIYGISGINDVALGTTSGQMFSGVALAIKMQPLFDAADEKDKTINDVLTQMLYDLVTIYFPIYEKVSFGDAMAYSESDQGDKLPFNREQRWKELMEGHEAGIFSLEYVYSELSSNFGYDLTAEDLERAREEQIAKSIMADPYGARVAGELSGS